MPSSMEQLNNRILIRIFEYSSQLDLMRKTLLLRTSKLNNKPASKLKSDVNVESVEMLKWYDLWYYFNSIWASVPGIIASYISFNLINVSNVGLFRLHVRCFILFVSLSSLPAILAVIGKVDSIPNMKIRNKF